MRNRPLCSVCLALALLICITVHVGKGTFIKELRPSPMEQCVQDGDVIDLEGQVYQKEIKENYQVLYLKNNSIYYQEQSLIEPRIIVYDENKIKIHIGNIVKVTGEVSFYEGERNPGNFDQRMYYAKQGIHGCIWSSRVEVTDYRADWMQDKLYTLWQAWKQVLYDVAGEKDGAILSAMILGDKSGMDSQTKELYQANGIGHIIAISGLHLSFIGIGIYKILRRITGSYSAGGIAGIVFLVLYILMIGFTVSAVRAFVMFLFRVGADMAGRHYDSPTAFAASLVIVLIWRPLSIYDGGFWMSFLAVAAVIVVLPLFEEHRFQGFWASVSINLMMLPVLLYYFYEFPLYSTVLNLFVIPLMSAILFLGMMGSLLTGMFVVLGDVMPLGTLMLRLCRVILWLYEKSCEITLELPGARIVTGQPQIWQITVYYVCLAVVLIWQYRIRTETIKRSRETTDSAKKCRRPHRYVPVFYSFILMLGAFVLIWRFEDMNRLHITVLDVGQGDGIFMRGPDGGTYLIDGGSSDVKNVGRYRIEPYLLSQGVNRLDYVFVSHGDSDHISGIEELLERQQIGVEIGTLVFPEKAVWDEAIHNLALCAAGKGVQVAVIHQGESLKEDGLEILCIQPSEEYRGENGNAASMVLAVKYKEFDMLFTGDVEGEGEVELTENVKRFCGDRKFEVLKVAHHGSKNSSSAEFLDVVNPACAVVSAGIDNRYGHPHEETVNRIEHCGSKIYSTQECGAVGVNVTEDRTWITRYIADDN